MPSRYHIEIHPDLDREPEFTDLDRATTREYALEVFTYHVREVYIPERRQNTPRRVVLYEFDTETPGDRRILRESVRRGTRIPVV